jgi:hypothetical protein
MMYEMINDTIFNTKFDINKKHKVFNFLSKIIIKLLLPEKI